MNSIRTTSTDGSSAEGNDRTPGLHYHKTIEAGKKTILVGFHGEDNLRAFKREFRSTLNNFMINMGADSPAHAEKVLAMASD